MNINQSFLLILSIQKYLKNKQRSKKKFLKVYFIRNEYLSFRNGKRKKKDKNINSAANLLVIRLCDCDRAVLAIAGDDVRPSTKTKGTETK